MPSLAQTSKQIGCVSVILNFERLKKKMEKKIEKKIGKKIEKKIIFFFSIFFPIFFFNFFIHGRSYYDAIATYLF